MADLEGVAGGAASGAAAGSVVPGWGTAIGAGIGALSSLFGGNSQADLQRASLQNAINEQNYQHALAALLMQQSQAGQTDAQGNQVVYNPATNQWETHLSASGRAHQTAQDYANQQANTRQVTENQASNARTAALHALMQREVPGAVNALANQHQVSADELRGALNTSSGLAAQQTLAPVLSATLRDAQRTGTSAAPVVAEMGRQAQQQLIQTMADNEIKARMGAGQINQANTQAAAGRLGAFAAAPQNMQMNGYQATGPDLNAQIAQAAMTRSGQMSQLGGNLAYSNTRMAGNVNDATKNVTQGTPGIFSRIGTAANNLFDNKGVQNIADEYLPSLKSAYRENAPTWAGGYDYSGAGYTAPASNMSDNKMLIGPV